jgi:DNA-directed RNA polymerase specialized sigma24 family protein
MKTEQLTLEQSMAGILALLAAARDEDENSRKTEVILADAGLSAGQIALILGKKSNTVSKTIARYKNGGGSE